MRGRSRSSGRYSANSWSRMRSCSARGNVIDRCEIDHDAHHSSPLDVTQELVSEPTAVARALDQAGYVGHHEVGVVVELHDAEVRLECGERIVGDLRLRRRDDADERRLAGVREPDEGDVGHESQFEPEPVSPRRVRPVRRSSGRVACWTGTWRCRVRHAHPPPPTTGRRDGPVPPSTRSCTGRTPRCPSARRSRATDPGGRGGPCPCRGRRCRPAGAG